jgi:Cof subfamily protein (haloacid dehalogenase superfamily)
MTKFIRAVALDLDGTIIGPDERISLCTAKAVSRLAKLVPVFINTGRERWEVKRYGIELGLTSPQACDNGAVIIDPMSNWEPLWHALLGSEITTKVLEKIRRERLPFIATSKRESVQDISLAFGREFARISVLDMKEDQAEKIMMALSSTTELQVVKAWLPYNKLWAVDCTPVGVDKGSAVRKVGNLLSIGTQHIAGVGDSYNDLPMFRECGLSISMGGAPNSVEKEADFVVSSVMEDGLVEAIEDIILPRLQIDG